MGHQIAAHPHLCRHHGDVRGVAIATAEPSRRTQPARGETPKPRPSPGPVTPATPSRLEDRVRVVVLLGVFLRDLRRREDGVLLDLLAVEDRLQPLEPLATDLSGVVEAGHDVVGAVEDRLERLLLAVDPGEDDVLLASGIADRLLRPKAHRVVLAEHGVDVVRAREHVLHHLLTAVGAPLSELGRLGRLDPGALKPGEHPVGASEADRVVGRAAPDDHDLPLAAQLLGEVLPVLPADRLVVGPDPARVVVTGQLPVHEHGRDVGLLRRIERGRSRLERPGADDQPVDPSGDQVLDVGRELGGVAVGVGRDHLDVARLGGRLLHGLRHADEVRGGEGEARHADRHLLLGAARSGPPVAAAVVVAAGRDGGRQQACRKHRGELPHETNLLLGYPRRPAGHASRLRARTTTTMPLPPARLAPPITHAAIASSSKATPTLGCAIPTREARITPASPAQKPLMTYASTRWRGTLIPASRTASLLPPIATVARPGALRLMNTQAAAKAASMITVEIGTGPIWFVPSARKPTSVAWIGV